jgi:hypothetical protein
MRSATRQGARRVHHRVRGALLELLAARIGPFSTYVDASGAPRALGGADGKRLQARVESAKAPFTPNRCTFCMFLRKNSNGPISRSWR